MKLETKDKDLLKTFEKYSKRIKKIDKLKLCTYQTILDIIGDKSKIKYGDIFLKKDYLIDLVNTIIYKTYDKKDKVVRLSSVYLRKKYGKHSSKYTKYLKEKKIINHPSNYLVGKQCNGYQLHFSIIESKSVLYTSYDKTLIEKTKKRKIQEFIESVNYNYISDKVIRHVIDSFEHVELEYNGALHYLNENVKGNKLTKNLVHLHMIDEKLGWFSIDENQRCHTPFTTLKSEVRDSYLTIEGEETKEIDISNSQPFFLTILVKKHLKELKWIDRDEYSIFKNLVKSGKYYRFFEEYAHGGNVKTKTFKVFFGKNEYKTKVENKFEQTFPTIYKFILWYKEKEKRYQALAKELQRSESNFIFNDVLEEVVNSFPNIRFFTVHDSIVVRESKYDEVKEIFDKHIDRIHQKL